MWGLLLSALALTIRRAGLLPQPTARARAAAPRCVAALPSSGELLPSVGPLQPSAEQPHAPLRLDERRLTCTVGGREFSILSGLASGVSLSGVSAEYADPQSCFLSFQGRRAKQEHIVALGTLGCERFLAAARTKRWWMGPAFGTRGAELPTETQFLLLELADGAYAFLLPLVLGPLRCTLRASSRWLHRRDGVAAQIDTGSRKTRLDAMEPFLLASVGTDPYELISRGFRVAAQRLGTFEVDSAANPKRVPKDVDLFGWCTWDAFYQFVDADGVRTGVSSLHAAGTPAGFLILDDGWQSVGEDGEAELLEQEQVLNDPAAAPGSGALQVLVSFVYRRFIDGARHDALQLRFWRLLARTVLRKPLTEFFVQNTPFTKRLQRFAANSKFEDPDAGTSLKQLLTSLRSTYGLSSVYCWHTLGGYWGGVSTTSAEMAHLAPTAREPIAARSLLEVEPALAWDAASLAGVGVVDDDQLLQFYNGMHSYLAGAGVDGVKVDGQSGLGPFGGAAAVRDYVHAMEASVAANFEENRCINCMCHSSENLFAYRSTAVLRAADDFYPLQKDSHPVHLAHIAYNSLFLAELGLPDWDMFQSKHGDAELHAAARAIGGCPVYVSDKPGEHNVDLLRKLVLPDGSVLRCQGAGRPTRDMLFSDPNADGVSALKIFNTNAHTAVVGAFNVQGSLWDRRRRSFAAAPEAAKQVTALVRADDVEGWAAGATVTDPALPPRPCVAYGYRSEVAGVLPPGASVELSLDVREWELVTLSPLQQLGAVQWAALGLGGMLNGGGAVVSSSLELAAPAAAAPAAAAPAAAAENVAPPPASTLGAPASEAAAAPAVSDTSLGAPQARVTLRASADFVAYCSPRPLVVRADGEQRTFSWTDGLLRVPLPRRAAPVALEVDFARPEA